MKTRVMILAVLMGLTTVVLAQSNGKEERKDRKETTHELRNENHRGPGSELNLTDTQKEAFQKSRVETEKLLQPLRNQLGEAEAHQRTLVTAEKPDMDAIGKNIEKIGAIKTDMEKIRTKQQLAVRSQLTEEQRLKFDNAHKQMKPGKAGERGEGGKRGHSEFSRL